MEKYFENLRQAVLDRDLLTFSRQFHLISSHCRKALFRSDKETLQFFYSQISSYLIWFLGKQDWPDVTRSIGGLEMLLSLIGNFLETRTLDEVAEEIRGNFIMATVLKELYKNRNGMRFSDLSEKNSPGIEDVLKRMRELGVIMRSGRLQFLCLYLTPKGEGIIVQCL